MGDYYFIPKFLKFQYPRGLSSNKPAIVAVRKELSDYSLNAIVSESLGNHYLMIKDKDKDKEKDKEKDKDKRVVFKPPTLKQVREYCKERGKGVDPNKWFNFYASKGWMIGKNKMKDWRAAIRTWEGNTDKTVKMPESIKQPEYKHPEAIDSGEQEEVSRMISETVKNWEV